MKCEAAGYFALVFFALVAPASSQTTKGPAPTLKGGHVAQVASYQSDAEIARQVTEALARVCNPNGSGAAVLVAKGDRILYRDARGMANIELGFSLSQDNVSRIASVTKMFTAAMILKLAEAGKLSLDDPLASYLPDFPNAGSITIRELLNHTSGVSDVPKDPQPGFSHRDLKTADQIAEISKRPLDFKPGTQFSYSNAGFILLGAVIEKVTGQAWHVAIQEQILQPLGMTHTHFGASGPLIPGRVNGYSTDNRTRAISNAGYISASFPQPQAGWYPRSTTSGSGCAGSQPATSSARRITSR